MLGRRRSVVLVLAFLLVLSLGACCGLPMEPQEFVTGDLEVIQSWAGDYPTAELHRLPEGQKQGPTGFFDTPAAFSSVWHAFKPGDLVPEVDFKKHLVVFSRNTSFYNHTSIMKVTADHGVVEVMTMSTMSAMPITDKVAMAMAVVPRAGVEVVRSGDQVIPVGK